MVRFLLLFVLALAPLFALEAQTTTQTIGNFTYTTGSVQGKAVNLTTQQIGQFQYTTGTVGLSRWNTTTQQIGAFSYTTGTVGQLPFTTTTQRIGQFDYTNGSIGTAAISTTGQRIGSFYYKSGTVGRQYVSSSTQRLGVYRYYSLLPTTSVNPSSRLRKAPKSSEKFGPVSATDHGTRAWNTCQRGSSAPKKNSYETCFTRARNNGGC